MQLLELHNFCFFIDDRQNTLSDIRQLSLSQTERGEGPAVSFKKLKYGNEVRFSYRPNTFIRHYTNKIFFFFKYQRDFLDSFFYIPFLRVEVYL